nr:isoprenylcysteine carboxylmethyltransferase family protein [Allomuricauda sp.]
MALKTEFRNQGNYLFRNRSYLPLIFLSIGLAVSLHGEYYETKGSENTLMDYWEFICLIVCLLGFFIRVKTVGHTPANTSGRNTRQGQVADELNTTGMYSLVRHPLYLGNFFMWLGIAMLVQNLWFIIAFVLLYTLYYERIMYAEEMYLIDKFKQDYTEWSCRTPAFVPKIKSYQQAKYPFNWKKVLKKEKNGFVAIFILIWVFEWSGDAVEHGIAFFELSVWFFAAFLSSILYLVLKILKRKKIL